ncbi:MAG: response regulator transcription factor [Bacteroidota bacterium]|nr:response regulator transcription factor [Bacteroidota bacterium]
MEKIKILIVEDHEVVIKGIRALLEPYNEIDIIGYALESEDAQKKMETLEPDIIIMDINLPGMSGIELTKIITDKYPGTKVIYYTSHVDERLITDGFEAGAFGYVPKDFSTEELVEAIHMVNDGQKYMKGIVSEKFISSFLRSEKEKKFKQIMPLSERELEVLKYLSQGLSNKQIADKLFISIRTVETHKHNLMKKLDIYSTAELVIYAIQNNIIQI